MANCRYCGRPVKGSKLACEECYANYSQYAIVTENRSDVLEDVELKETCVWDYFATIGNVFGYASIIFCFIPFCSFVGFFFASHGIVFSCLGRKSKTHEERTNSGIVFSIAALFISILMGAGCIFCTITCFNSPT